MSFLLLFVSILKKNVRKNLSKVFYLLDSEYNWKKIIKTLKL